MASPAPVSPLCFRALTPADLPAARALWAQAEGVELAEGDDPAALERYLHRNPGLSQGAWLGEQLIGAVLAGHDGRRGFLYHLSVDPAQRRAGIGHRLVQDAVAGLQSSGMSRVLILVARENAAGRAFWQRRGWEAVDGAEAFGLTL